MKKIFVGIGLIVIVFVFGGCAQGGTVNGDHGTATGGTQTTHIDVHDIKTPGN